MSGDIRNGAEAYGGAEDVGDVSGADSTHNRLILSSSGAAQQMMQRAQIADIMGTAKPQFVP